MKNEIHLPRMRGAISEDLYDVIYWFNNNRYNILYIARSNDHIKLKSSLQLLEQDMF